MQRFQYDIKNKGIRYPKIVRVKQKMRKQGNKTFTVSTFSVICGIGNRTFMRTIENSIKTKENLKYNLVIGKENYLQHLLQFPKMMEAGKEGRGGEGEVIKREKELKRGELKNGCGVLFFLGWEQNRRAGRCVAFLSLRQRQSHC